MAADRLLGDRGDGFAELPVGKADEALGRRAVSLLKWLDFKVDAYSDADGRNLGKHVEAMRRWVTDDGGTLAVAAATALATVDMGAAELLSLGDCVAQVRRRALAASPEEVADRLHAHGMWAMEKHEGLLVQHRANVLELPSIGDAAVLGIRIMLIANLYGELYRLLPIRPLT